MPPHQYRFLLSLLLAPSGRINPAQYWFATFVGAAAGALSHKLFGPEIAEAVVIYLTAVATMKRLHDRCKSAWWLSLYWLAPAVALGFTKGIIAPPASPTLQFAGLVIGLCALGELGLLSGTVGPSLYGPDSGQDLIPNATPATAGGSE